MLLLCSGVARSDETGGVREGDLEVVVSGLRNQDGQLLISLYVRAEGFPEDRKIVRKTLVVDDLPKGEASVVFEDLPAGDYAIAILHDEDENGDMTYRLGILPKEGYGFSNNVKPRLKAPSFAETKVDLGVGGKSIEIVVIY